VRDYWNQRFSEGGRIWGDSPSPTALRAKEIFLLHGARKILVPGAGYGRHTGFFAAEGFDVHAIEISEVAIGLAGRSGAGVIWHRGSVLEMPFSGDRYDAIYCFNLLHFFRAADRRAFIGKCAGQLRTGGIAFFTVFSEKEPGYGRGRKVEEDTFETKPGRPTHFFSEADLRDHFAGLEVLETGLAEDPENHGDEGPHVHRLRWIAAAGV
jgi:SAM-dependent methyltransferase